jgi:PmbA protein
MIKTLQTVLDQGEKTGFSTVEAFAETIEKHEYECFPDEPPSLHAIDTQQVTVRAFWDSGNPVGFSLSKPNFDSIKSAFSTIYTSSLPDEKENYGSLLPGEAKKSSVIIFDESINSVDVHTFNEFIDGINEIMISPPFQGLKIQKIHLAKTLKKIYIANTNNLNVKYRKTNFNMTLSFTLGPNRMDISENRIFFQQFEPYKIISRGYNLLNSLTQAGVSSGKHMALILSPEASAFILREFSHYFKISADKEIMNIHYPSILNLVDNPAMDDQVGSVPFDDEGMQSGEKYLIQKGFFSSVISDIASAFQNNTRSTGSGFRKDRSMFPSVEFSNLYIKPTVLPLKNLMSDAGEGVLVSLLKLKAIDNNGYLFSAYGYRFRNDDLLEPVHFYFRTSFRSYFLKISKISKEIKFFYSSANIGSPYILLEARKQADNLFEI